MIEETVIKALQKNYVPMKRIKQVKAFNEEGMVIDGIFNTDGGECFKYLNEQLTLKNGVEFNIKFLSSS